MIGRLFTALSVLCIGSNGCLAEEPVIKLVPKSTTDAIIEVGYWKGEGNGIAGHIWIALKPFQLGEDQFPNSTLNLNRFKIHLPYDLNKLNDREIDCDSDEFSFGPNGNLTIRAEEGREILLTPGKIRFKRTGNQTFDMAMSGYFITPDSPTTFTIRSSLNIQFGYGAREPHPNDSTIEKAIQLTGGSPLPRWCDETYEFGQNFEHISQTFILLRLHRKEDFQKWKDKFPPLDDFSSLALPQFEAPEWWITDYLATEMTEDQESEVFYNEKAMTEDEEGNKVGFGMSVKIPGQLQEPSQIITGDLTSLLSDSTTLEFRHYPHSANSSGWIALQPGTKNGGSIFIFSTSAKVVETGEEHQ